MLRGQVQLFEGGELRRGVEVPPVRPVLGVVLGSVHVVLQAPERHPVEQVETLLPTPRGPVEPLHHACQELGGELDCHSSSKRGQNGGD